MSQRYKSEKSLKRRKIRDKKDKLSKRIDKEKKEITKRREEKRKLIPGKARGKQIGFMIKMAFMKIKINQ